MMGEWRIVNKNIIHGGDKNYYVPILISYLVILIGVKYLEEFQLYFGIVGGLSWVTFYTLRFRKKESRKFIDYLKFILAIFFGLSAVESSFGFTEVEFVIISALLMHLVYIIDRLVLNARRKFSYVLTSVSGLLTVFFIVFANIQTDLAKEAKNQADKLASQAIQLVEVAEKEASNARKSQPEALLAKQDAERTMELLLECRNK